METVGSMIRDALRKRRVDPSPWKTLPERIGVRGSVSWDTLRKIVNEDYARARDHVYTTLAQALQIDPVSLLQQVHLQRMAPEVRQRLESRRSAAQRSAPTGKPSRSHPPAVSAPGAPATPEKPLIGITSVQPLTHAHAGIYLTPIHHAVVEACYALGYRTEWVHHDALYETAQNSLAGLIYVSAREDEIRRLAMAEFGAMPIVLVNRMPRVPHLHAVTIDYRAWAGRGTDHLVRLGHRRIGFVGVGEAEIYLQQRLQGYRDSLERHGIQSDSRSEVFLSSIDPVQIQSDMLPLLKRGSVTALFIASGQTVAPVLTALHCSGCAVPDDLSVVAFDDAPNPLYPIMPALTVIRQPLEELGRRSVELVHRLRRGAVTGQVIDVIPAELVVRNSCRAVEDGALTPRTAEEVRASV